MDNKIQFVLTKVVKKDKTSIDAEFTINGKKVTYDKISFDDKYNFAMVCRNASAMLARMCLAEQDINTKELEK